MIRTRTPPNIEVRPTSRTLPAAVSPAVLIALGLASAGLYWWGRDLHRFTQWLAAYSWLFIGQLALYLTACYVVMRGDSRSRHTIKLLTTGAVLVFAAAFRVELVAQQPFLSSDVYRYVWDGRVQAAGVNPYRYAPDAEELRELRDDKIFPNITEEDRGWLSPYPPVAQAVFLAVYKLLPSVTGFKLAMSLFDLIALLLIMLTLDAAGLDPARAIVFAWHPLVIFETAHSGHVESVYIAFITLTLWAWSRRSHALTGVAVALAALVKFYPALLLPVFITATQATSPERDSADAGQPDRGKFWLPSPLQKLWNGSNLKMLAAFVATTVAAYLPYLGAGGRMVGFLGGYFSEEGFGESGARYFLLTLARKIIPLPTSAFLLLGVLVLGALALKWMVKPKRDAVEVASGASALIGGFLLLTTPRYAWYYVWLLPFLCFAPRLGWLYLTSAASLLYLVWYTPLVYPGVPQWLGAAVYLPTMALLTWERAQHRNTAPTRR
jgi:alpha-1,6-mannosyltransferase